MTTSVEAVLVLAKLRVAYWGLEDYLKEKVLIPIDFSGVRYLTYITVQAWIKQLQLMTKNIYWKPPNEA